MKLTKSAGRLSRAFPSFVLEFITESLANEIETADIDMKRIKGQFLCLWRVSENNYEYKSCSKLQKAKKQMGAVSIDTYYRTVIDLSLFTVGTFTENKSKARNIYKRFGRCF